MLQCVPRIRQVVQRAAEVRSPGPRLDDVRRIVVSRTDRLGDLVLTLPALRALRRAYADAWIALLVRPELEPIARLAEDADRVVVDPGNSDALRDELLRFGTDLVLCVARGVRVPWAAYRAGIRHRVGTGYRAYSPLFDLRVDEHRRRLGRHEVEYAMSFAHRVGAPAGPAEFPMRVPKTAVEAALGWLSLQRLAGPFVILHPGSGGSCPSWPMSHHVQLATLLEGEGHRVVFTIGPGAREVADALDEEHPRIRRLPRFTGDVVSLAGLVSLAACVVSSSTGPAHLASALGAPTLALHVPWPSCGPERWGPYSSRGWALVADAPGASVPGRRLAPRVGEALMHDLSPSVALRCVLDILSGVPPSLNS